MKASGYHEEPEVAPARLLDEGDELGELLRQANRAPVGRGRAFRRVLDLHRRRRISRPVFVIAASIAAAYFLWISVPQVQELPIAAENVEASLVTKGAAQHGPFSPDGEQAKREAGTRGEESRVPPKPLTSEKAVAAEGETVDSSETVQGAKAVGGQAAVRDSNAAPAGKVAPQQETDCAALSRSAKYSESLACYELKGEGTGMSAELALLEAARLERRALSRSDRALQKLNTYRHRFPQGMLRREAELLRIEILIELGKRREARVAIEAAVPLAPDLADSLFKRAFELALGDGDCEGARAYAKRLAVGAQTDDDLALRLASCVSEL